MKRGTPVLMVLVSVPAALSLARDGWWVPVVAFSVGPLLVLAGSCWMNWRNERIRRQISARQTEVRAERALKQDPARRHPSGAAR